MVLLLNKSPSQPKTYIFPKLTCEAINHFVKRLALPRDTLRYQSNENLIFFLSYLEFSFYFAVEYVLGSNLKLQ